MPTTQSDQDGLEEVVRAVVAMDRDVPGHRRILEMEGLRRWVRPELDGHAPVRGDRRP